MTAKYTKGPWAVRQPFYSKDNLFAVFCGMSGRTRRLDNLKGEFVEADARLIAAAPELVAALLLAESFIAGFEDDPLQDGINERLAAIRNALKKAGVA